MTDQSGRSLGVGDPAPDFDLPAADRDGRISLSDYYRRGPVLLLLLRGLYCSFCRRHISRLKSSCDMLQSAGIPMLGVVIASAERSRLYFRYRNAPCFFRRGGSRPISASRLRSARRGADSGDDRGLHSEPTARASVNTTIRNPIALCIFIPPGPRISLDSLPTLPGP
jgi:AhpC/TSA family